MRNFSSQTDDSAAIALKYLFNKKRVWRLVRARCIYLLLVSLRDMQECNKVFTSSFDTTYSNSRRTGEAKGAVYLQFT